MKYVMCVNKTKTHLASDKKNKTNSSPLPLEFSPLAPGPKQPVKQKEKREVTVYKI